MRVEWNRCSFLIELRQSTDSQADPHSFSETPSWDFQIDPYFSRSMIDLGYLEDLALPQDHP